VGQVRGGDRRLRTGSRAESCVARKRAPARVASNRSVDSQQGGLKQMEIRFLGHACFELSDGSDTVLIDPFLSGNPKAAIAADDAAATTILLTHGHSDHIGDTVSIAKRTGAPVMAIIELAGEVGEEGVDVIDPNLGGTAKFDWGWAKL